MTVNLPDKLHEPLVTAAKIWRYEGKSEACVALILWDIYSRQVHAITGPKIRQPQWAIDSAIEELLQRLNIESGGANFRPRRFTVNVPDPIYPLAQERKREEHYRSDSAYIVSLVLFALDPTVPKGKQVPHHKLAPLMHEPKYIRDLVFTQLAKDFGDSKRTWPHEIGARIDDIVKQLTLRLNA